MYDIIMNLIMYGSKIIQMIFYNFEKCGQFHTFLTITKLDIPLKVPNLLALGHNYLVTTIDIERRLQSRAILFFHHGDKFGGKSPLI